MRQAQRALERSHVDLKELIAALDDMREEEQKRLAREMHDDLGQLLTTMKMDLSDLRQHLPQNSAKLLQRLDHIHDLVNAMITSVRRIIADLPPKMLEDLGLFSALEVMAAHFQERHGMPCRLRLPKREVVFEPKTAIAIYRMIQEALNNVVKHADATRVNLTIDLLDECIALCVADDGKGMAEDAARKTGSFGLIGIRERTASLQGEMKIESYPNTGTTIRITIPRGARYCGAGLTRYRSTNLS